VRGRPSLIIDVPGGFRRVIPIEWTDLRPIQSCSRVKGRLVLFDPWQLLAVVRLVAEKLTTAIDGSESRGFEPSEVAAAVIVRGKDRDQDARVRDPRSSAARGDRALVRRSRVPSASTNRRRP